MIGSYHHKYYPKLVSLYLKLGLRDEAKKVIGKLVQPPVEEHASTYARALSYYQAIAVCYEKIEDVEKALRT
ncbi:hypothetical protein [Thermofilum sp.]|uniref:hypothetical protein n=1 Tax=Thermofilum sp. TaxID=1961369 RepID=UPI003169E26C